MVPVSFLWRSIAVAAVVFGTAAAPTPASAQSRNLQNVARNLVQAGMVKAGDKVLVSGSIRDAALLEDIAIEAMKVGAHPLITISSDRLARRSYDEVPSTFDNVTSSVDMLLVNNFDVQIALDVNETEGLLAGVPMARRSARGKAYQAVNDAYFKRNIRLVNLGNGLYPTAAISRRLGVPRATVSNAFWRAAGVNASLLRTKGESLREIFANGKVVTLTARNGTNLSLMVDADRGFISDGALTPEKVRQGAAAAATYLPAGELILPATSGSASGKIVLDRYIWDGRVVRGLTLVFDKGVLTSMTAASDISGLKAAYDAAGGAKDRFGFLDIGINPETRLPVGSGRIIWTAPGSVAFGFGENRGFGGSNSSDFGLVAQIGGATLTVDGRPVIERGRLR